MTAAVDTQNKDELDKNQTTNLNSIEDEIRASNSISGLL